MLARIFSKPALAIMQRPVTAISSSAVVGTVLGLLHTENQMHRLLKQPDNFIHPAQKNMIENTLQEVKTATGYQKPIVLRCYYGSRAKRNMGSASSFFSPASYLEVEGANYYARAENKAELKAVFTHEIEHLAKHHHEKIHAYTGAAMAATGMFGLQTLLYASSNTVKMLQILKAKYCALNGFKGAAAIFATPLVAPALISAGPALFNAAMLFAYRAPVWIVTAALCYVSRQHEYTADNAIVRYCSRDELNSAIRYFEDADENEKKPRSTTSLFDTHPSYSDRKENMEEQAEKQDKLSL